MINKRQSFNQEFKIETVKLIKKEGYSLSEASIRLGISKTTLSRWKNLYGHKQDADSLEKPDSLSIFEQKQLQKELERVRRERDILKKALAYFATDPQK